MKFSTLRISYKRILFSYLIINFSNDFEHTIFDRRACNCHRVIKSIIVKFGLHFIHVINQAETEETR